MQLAGFHHYLQRDRHGTADTGIFRDGCFRRHGRSLCRGLAAGFHVRPCFYNRTAYQETGDAASIQTRHEYQNREIRNPDQRRNRTAGNNQHLGHNTDYGSLQPLGRTRLDGLRIDNLLFHTAETARPGGRMESNGERNEKIAGKGIVVFRQ